MKTITILLPSIIVVSSTILSITTTIVTIVHAFHVQQINIRYKYVRQSCFVHENNINNNKYNTNNFNIHNQQYHQQQQAPFFMTTSTQNSIPNNDIENTSTTTSNNNNNNYNNNNEYIIPNGITVKIAIDSQGGVYETQSKSKSKTDNINNDRFTCSSSLDLVHRLRCVSDCIIIGYKTVINDNPTLTIRRNITCYRTTGRTRNDNSSSKNNTQFQPLRVIIDPQLTLLKTNTNNNNEFPLYNIFTDGLPTVVYYTTTNSTSIISQQRINEFKAFSPTTDLILIESKKIVSASTSLQATQQQKSESQTTKSEAKLIIHPNDIIQHLQSLYNIQHIMIEGGPSTVQYFLQNRLIDRCIIVHATSVTFEQPLLLFPSNNKSTSSNRNKNKDNINNNNNNNNNDNNDDWILSYLQENLIGMNYIGSRTCDTDTIYYYTKNLSNNESSSSSAAAATSVSWPTNELFDWP